MLVPPDRHRIAVRPPAASDLGPQPGPDRLRPHAGPGLATDSDGPFRAPQTRAAAAVALTSVVLSMSASAHADTARLEIAPPEAGVHPTRIVVTSATGDTRTLGPYPVPSRTRQLVRSPDGRSLALIPGFDASDGAPTIVPFDGGAPARLQPPPGIVVVPPLSAPSWAPDGSELLIGHAHAERTARGAARWPALRCPAPAFACRKIPGTDGLAAALPGGLVAGSTLFSLFPSSRALGILVSVDGFRGAWLRRNSRNARALERVIAQRVTSRTSTVVDGRRRTIDAVRRSARQGVPVTTSIVAGPSGALVTQETYRVTIRKRGDRMRGVTRYTPHRLVHVAADGTTRTTPAPWLTIPAADREPPLVHGWRRKAKRFPVVPEVALPRERWLATVGTQSSVKQHPAVALARIASDGTARFVRANGRIVTAHGLLELVPDTTGRTERAGLTVVGYEHATGAAIVAVGWWDERNDDEPAVVTLRVPLDGRTSPTVVSRTAEQAAW
jgi:hypothetical protein